MKKILCFFMVALVAAFLVVPCFAVETTAAPSDPVDWFGGGTSVVGYRVTWSGSVNHSIVSDVNAWLAVVAPDSDSAVGSFSGTPYSGATFTDVACYYGPSNPVTVSGVNVYYLTNIDVTITGQDGRSLAESISGVTVVDVVEGSNGFVDVGFSDALTELSTIVSAILSNQYILIAIGLAVAVPLVAWGISKIKSLVKGY